jgi:tRNA splicing ligase
MKLAEYLDTKKLLDHIQRGIVQVNFHPTLPLALYHYSRKCLFDHVWDDVTRKCRGLIVDTNTTEIIARPFEKFFSKGQDVETDERLETIDDVYGPPVIQEKVNGSLGIFWRYGIHWGIATKGSFTSDHAKWATKWLEDHIEEHGKLVFPEGYTPVFEIICQTVQEHVIKYKKDGLFLLAIINNETGEELPPFDVFNYAKKNNLRAPVWHGLSLRDALTGDDWGNHFEGYVVTYHIPGKTPFKLKIKFPTYLENRKKFYEEQEAKKQESVLNTRTTEYDQIFKAVTSIVEEALKVCTTRKEFAEFFKEETRIKYSSVCFALIDEGDYKKAIWKMINKEDIN